MTLVRNPAFSESARDGLTLSTTTSGGKRLAFRMDAEAKALWDSIPTLAQHEDGRSVTVAQLLDIAVAKCAQHNASVVRREAGAFLQAASKAGLVLRPGIFVAEIRKPKDPA